MQTAHSIANDHGTTGDLSEIPEWMIEFHNRKQRDKDALLDLLSRVGGDRSEHPIYSALVAGNAIFGDEWHGRAEGRRRFVIEHGREFTMAQLPKGVRKRKLGTCYESSSNFALTHQNEGYVYVEGFAMRRGAEFMSGELYSHAWLTCGNGEAIDLTWRKNDDCLYFGVEFCTLSLAHILLVRGYNGLLDPVDDLVTKEFGISTATLRKAA